MFGTCQCHGLERGEPSTSVIVANTIIRQTILDVSAARGNGNGFRVTQESVNEAIPVNDGGRRFVET